MLHGMISNAHHTEYGVVTVPFPIPEDEYDHILGLLEAMGIGDALQRDCQVEELTGNIPVLKRLEVSLVNLDELDYLAKRLNSFDAGEAAQFQAMAEMLDLRNLTDFINLTFCCQQVTVITDFSDLEAVGRDHYLNLHGGCASTEELEALDGYETALLLIDSATGTVTPYGVVYDNGMKLEQFYDGRHFPEYLYDDALLVLRITPKGSDQSGRTADYLYLPAPSSQIERTLLRAGISSFTELQLSLESDELSPAVRDTLDIAGEDIGELNDMCHELRRLSSSEMTKLSAAVLLAKPESAFEVCEIAKNLELFDFVPDVSSPEEYGKFMIRESGHFDYDPDLEGFYDYKRYGRERIDQEQGQFNELGYIAYKGTLTMDELLCGDPVKQMDQEMGGMV